MLLEAFVGGHLARFAAEIAKSEPNLPEFRLRRIFVGKIAKQGFRQAGESLSPKIRGPAGLGCRVRETATQTFDKTNSNSDCFVFFCDIKG